LADKLQRRPNVTACFFGEGAVAEGEFHESLNLAALWRLPVLFVCENNLYAMGTAIQTELATPCVARKADGYHIQNASVDGMDLLAVRAAARDALAIVRQGQPFLLECRTYRFRAHSMFDAELYRSKAEVEQWKQRDPIELFYHRAREMNLLDEPDRQAVEREVADEVEAAVAFAEAGSWEPIEDLTRFVYAEQELR
jgi:pyruvate dehydrogenase E1 component alpha subunit/2-oxoisovalerate dehydrogenase E1 component